VAPDITRRQFGEAIGAAALSAALPRAPAAAAQTAASELCYLSARELANRLRLRQVSAREVMAAHLAQIERVNPSVNAIVTLVADRALADAARADEMAAGGRALGVLHGLPVAHKDLVDTAGIRTTRGSRFFLNNVPTRDALIVQRIHAAGALTLGKTNTPEFGAGSQTFNAVFGATRNPYDLSKTCGGSSGGAAVALACGMVPIADGSDTGGSLRNPPAFCNVVGLRPSPGRVPAESGSWSPLSVQGPLARSVGDVALFLSAIAGPDSRSPLSIQEDGSRFLAPLERNFKGSRVAWWRGLGGIPVEPEIRRLVDSNRGVFEQLGCVVEEDEPDFDGVADAFPILRYAGNHAQYAPARCAESRLGQGHHQVRSDPGGTSEGRRRWTGTRAPGPHARPNEAVLRTVRLFRASGDAGGAVRRDAGVSDRHQRPGHDELHRLDALLLVRDIHGQPRDVCARRLYVERAAGRAPGRRTSP
jgi:amidase